MDIQESTLTPQHLRLSQGLSCQQRSATLGTQRRLLAAQRADRDSTKQANSSCLAVVCVGAHP